MTVVLHTIILPPIQTLGSRGYLELDRDLFLILWNSGYIVPVFVMQVSINH